MWVICRNDYPVAVTTTEELAEYYKGLIQKHFDDEMRMEELRGNGHRGKSYNHIRQVPELKSDDNFIKVLGFNRVQ
jgi:hypothetical protein